MEGGFTMTILNVACCATIRPSGMFLSAQECAGCVVLCTIDGMNTGDLCKRKMTNSSKEYWVGYK